MANKDGASRKNSGSGQGGFSTQDQTVAPRLNDKAAQSGLEGRDAKETAAKQTAIGSD